jgi:hypothetical protein
MERKPVIQCHTCGRDQLYGVDTGHYCSPRCQELAAEGFPPYQPVDLRRLFATTWRVSAGGDPGYIPAPMKMGPEGFFTKCPGCSGTFESKGLRCCSKECERRYRDRVENIQAMAELGMEPATKRLCEAEGCGKAIPRWRKGRRGIRGDPLLQPVMQGQRTPETGHRRIAIWSRFERFQSAPGVISFPGCFCNALR